MKTRSLRGTATTCCLPRSPGVWFCTLVIIILLLPQALLAQRDSLAGFDEAAVMEEIRQKGIPESDIPGYLEYKKQEFAGKKNGTWQRINQGPGDPPVPLACNNMDFETGDATGWSGTYGTNPGCTPTCLNFGFVAGRHTIVTGAGMDPCAPFPMVAPGGSFSFRLGNNINGGEAEQLVQTFLVTLPTFIYSYAVVLQDPGHTVLDQPFFEVEMFDSLMLPINCANIRYVAGPNIPGFFPSAACGAVYRPWTSVAVDLTLYVGQNVTIRFTIADCVQLGHWGYVYIDGSCDIGAITQSNVLCSGGTTTLCAPVGFATYNWSTGATTQCITVNAPGNYQVTMTAQGGCQVLPLTITVQEFPSPTMNVNSNNSSCTGCTGTATATVVGGNTPYSYSWSPSLDTTASVANLCAGNYTAVVTTTDGCTDTSSIVIGNPANFLPAASSSTPPSCNGGNNGTATVNTSGGTPPFTYSWNTTPVQTTQTATGLAAGPYMVTVTDSTGCMFTTTITVTEPSPVLPISVSQFNVSCSGLCDGSADIAMSGGNAPYSYAWTGSSSITSSATNLCAGPVSVMVTDATGCTGTQTFLITDPGPITLASSSTDATCGMSDGSASVVAGGGVGNFTYSWNTNPVQTTPTASGLGVGLYVVTVTDGNMCTNNDTVQVFNPNAPTATSTATPVSCFGGTNGTATGSASGGTGTLVYSWNTTPPQATPALNNLPAGYYTLTVTDSLGCQVVTAANVTQPPQLILAIAGFPETCATLCNGQAVVIPSGGTGNYNILWSNNDTTASSNGLCPGNYSVNITDANGCAASASTSVPAATPITLTMSSVNSFCGANTASASATPSGGTGSGTYTYLWNGNLTTQTITSLASGTYIVVVTDNNSCTQTDSVQVVSTPAVTATSALVNVSCFGMCDGSGNVSVTTGTAPYNYAWSAGPPNNTPSGTNLCAGNYIVTVTDSNGCTLNVPLVITEPLQLATTITAVPPIICAGQSATLTAQSAGGTAAYQYLWMPGNLPGNSITVTPSASTTYLVNTVDANNCPATATVTLTVNPPPVVCIIADLNGCQPFCTQMTNCNPTVDSCFWDFGDGTFFMGCTPPVHCYPTPGTYPVVLTVTDNNGCTNTSLTNGNIVSVTPKPVAAFTVSPMSTSVFEPYVNFTDLSTGAVSWFWDFRDPLSSSPTSTLQNPSHTFSDTGMYCVRLAVTSADSCMDTATICVVIEPEFTFFIPNAFTPDGDGINDFFIGYGIGIAKHQMWIFDRWGNMIFTSGESASPQTGVPWDGRANGGKEVAQQDVYVWKVALTDVFGRSYMYIGHVSLIK